MATLNTSPSETITVKREWDIFHNTENKKNSCPTNQSYREYSKQHKGPQTVISIHKRLKKENKERYGFGNTNRARAIKIRVANMHVSIMTLNINVLNSQVKSQRMVEQIKKKKIIGLLFSKYSSHFHEWILP